MILCDFYGQGFKLFHRCASLFPFKPTKTLVSLGLFLNFRIALLVFGGERTYDVSLICHSRLVMVPHFLTQLHHAGQQILIGACYPIYPPSCSRYVRLEEFAGVIRLVRHGMLLNLSVTGMSSNLFPIVSICNL